MRQLLARSLFASLDYNRDFVHIEHGNWPIKFWQDGKDFSVVGQVVEGKRGGQDIVHINAVELFLDRGHRAEAGPVIECKAHRNDNVRTVLDRDIDW